MSTPETTHDVSIRALKALRGPNLYARFPLLHATLDIGSYEERPSNTFPGLTERLTEWLPGLQEHPFKSDHSTEDSGSFIEQLQRGIYLPHICEHVALELQTMMGFDTRFGRVMNADERGVYHVLVGYIEEQPARIGFETALRLTLAAMHGEPFDMAVERKQLTAVATRYRLESSVGVIVEAARRHNIPVMRLVETYSVIQVGYGVNQKRMMASLLEMNEVEVAKPPTDQNSVKVDVDGAVGLYMEFRAVGHDPDAGAPMIGVLYPDDVPSRIPVIAVTGTNGKTTVTRLIAHMYETTGKVVGMTLTEGIYIDGERVYAGDCSGPTSAQAVLLHPFVEVAVLETARGGIIRAGLAFDECKVGVVTNISADHMGLRGVNTLDDLANVKQVVVEAIARDGAAVLNADDPLVAEMAAATDAEIVYFSMNAATMLQDNPVYSAHFAAGGRCVCVENNQIVLVAGGERTLLIELDRVGFTYHGKLHFQVMNALAAAAAAWAEGLNPAMIAQALTTFVTDSATVPGRFNITELNGRQIILDYGHNVAAVKAFGQAVLALPPRRTVVALCLPGDRADSDLRATVEATLPFVDSYVLYDSGDLRGRAPLEVPRLAASVLPSGKPRLIADTQREAIQQAWEQLQSGDRLVVIADVVDRTLDVLRSITGLNE